MYSFTEYKAAYEWLSGTRTDSYFSPRCETRSLSHSRNPALCTVCSCSFRASAALSVQMFCPNEIFKVTGNMAEGGLKALCGKKDTAGEHIAFNISSAT